MCKICSKLRTKTTDRRRSGTLIVKFEQIPHIVVVSQLLTLSKQIPAEIQTQLNPQITYKVNRVLRSKVCRFEQNSLRISKNVIKRKILLMQYLIQLR